MQGDAETLSLVACRFRGCPLVPHDPSNHDSRLQHPQALDPSPHCLLVTPLAHPNNELCVDSVYARCVAAGSVVCLFHHRSNRRTRLRETAQCAHTRAHYARAHMS